VDYQSYRKSAGERFGHVAWAPNWEIILTHMRPDGVSAGEFGRSYFVNRHVRPDIVFDWAPRVTRDSAGNDETPTGCHVSAAASPPGTGGSSQDDIFAPQWTEAELRSGRLYRADDGKTAHQRDWDILSEAVQQAYTDAGVTEKSPVFERLQALVALQNQHKGNRVYPSRHPVDTLLHYSYCTGAANLFAALCMVAGFPARTLNNAIHSMAEVWDGVRWLFVDNLTEGQIKELSPRPGVPADAIFKHNYVQMLAGQGTCTDGTPMNPVQAVRYAEEQPFFEPFINVATRDWRFNHGRIGLAPAVWPRDIGVGMFALPGPDNIRAIYPEWSEPLLFSRAGVSTELCLTPRQAWLETLVRVDRGLGLCKSFYVGGLDDGRNPVQSARADLHLSDWLGGEFSPTRGGWNLLLNGKPLPLNGSCYRQHTDLLSFDLPVNGLREYSLNRLELYSDKHYTGQMRYRMPDMLAIRAYPDVLGHELPWYASAEATRYLAKWEPPEGTTAVRNTHSAWMMAERMA
jgi:hypothetical protein